MYVLSKALSHLALASFLGLLLACGPVGDPPDTGQFVFSDEGQLTVPKTNPDSGEVKRLPYTFSGDTQVMNEIAKEVDELSKPHLADQNKSLAASIRDEQISLIDKKGSTINDDNTKVDSVKVNFRLVGEFDTSLEFNLKLENSGSTKASQFVRPTSQPTSKYKYQLRVKCREGDCRNLEFYLKAYEGDDRTWSKAVAYAGFHHKISHPKFYFQSADASKDFENPELQALHEKSKSNKGDLGAIRTKTQILHGQTHTSIKVPNENATSESDRYLIEIDSDVVDTQTMASIAKAKFNGKDSEIQLVGSNPASGNLMFDANLLQHTPPATQPPKAPSDKAPEPTQEEKDEEPDTNSSTPPVASAPPIRPEVKTESFRIIIIEDGEFTYPSLNPADYTLPDLSQSLVKINVNEDHPDTKKMLLLFEAYRNHPKVQKLIEIYTNTGDKSAWRDRYGKKDGIEVALNYTKIVYNKKKKRNEERTVRINDWDHPAQRFLGYLNNLPNIAPVLEHGFSHQDILPTVAHLTVHETNFATRKGVYGSHERGDAGEGGAFQFMLRTARRINNNHDIGLSFSDSGIDDRYFFANGVALTAAYMRTNLDALGKGSDPAFILMAHNSGLGNVKKNISETLEQSRFRNFPMSLALADEFTMWIRVSRYYAFSVLAWHFVSLNPDLYNVSIDPYPYSQAKPKIERSLFNGSTRPRGFENFEMPSSL